MHEANDIKTAGQVLHKAYLIVLNKHAPIKVIQNRTNYVPYITRELKNLMMERDNLKVRASKTGDNIIYPKYKNIRNKVSTKLKTAKSDYYKEKFKDNLSTSSDTWNNVNKVLGKTRSEFPSQIMIAGKLLSRTLEIANGMNLSLIHI